MIYFLVSIWIHHCICWEIAVHYCSFKTFFVWYLSEECYFLVYILIEFESLEHLSSAAWPSFFKSNIIKLYDSCHTFCSCQWPCKATTGWRHTIQRPWNSWIKYSVCLHYLPGWPICNTWYKTTIFGRDCEESKEIFYIWDSSPGW